MIRRASTSTSRDRPPKRAAQRCRHAGNAAPGHRVPRSRRPPRRRLIGLGTQGSQNRNRPAHRRGAINLLRSPGATADPLRLTQLLAFSQFLADGWTRRARLTAALRPRLRLSASIAPASSRAALTVCRFVSYRQIDKSPAPRATPESPAASLPSVLSLPCPGRTRCRRQKPENLGFQVIQQRSEVGRVCGPSRTPGNSEFPGEQMRVAARSGTPKAIDDPGV